VHTISAPAPDDRVVTEGSRAIRMTTDLGGALLLFGAILRALTRPRDWARGVVAEADRQIVDSIGLVVVVSLLGGGLIAQQTGVQFEGNLPSWVVGAIVAASTVTEITPLFAGIMISGVVGTRIAAEIGAMRVTEQVDALEVMGRDPVAYLVVPRVAGAILAAPVLMSFALASSLVAGWGAAVLVTPATSADFWFGVRHYMRDFPLFFALMKGVVFCAFVALESSWCGLEAGGGSQGVGRATRRAVVIAIVGIILLDVSLVPLLKWVRI
jgi:phospholipid/cholesterol/gamma-HCH transport system permease protein